MHTSNHMFWSFDVFSQKTLVGRIHAKTMKLVKCWKDGVADFRKKDVSGDSVDGTRERFPSYRLDGGLGPLIFCL